MALVCVGVKGVFKRHSVGSEFDDNQSPFYSTERVRLISTEQIINCTPRRAFGPPAVGGGAELRDERWANTAKYSGTAYSSPRSLSAPSVTPSVSLKFSLLSSSSNTDPIAAACLQVSF